MMLCINIYVALGLPCQILARWRSPGPPVLTLSPAKKHAGLAVVRAAAGLSDGRVRHSLLRADPRPARCAVLPTAIPAAIPASLFPTWCQCCYWHCHVAVGSVCPPVLAPPGALSAAPCCSPWRSHWRGMVCWQQGGPNPEVLRWVLLPSCCSWEQGTCCDGGHQVRSQTFSGPRVHVAGAGRVAAASVPAVG